MCIRDSNGTNCTGVNGDDNAILEGNQIYFDDYVKFCCSDAVSYTHLRAHETVLDLVCRLLLEKKKTKQLSPFIPSSNDNHNI